MSERFPSSEETMRHPAYGSAVWALEPHSHGKLAVAKDRSGGPMNIYWEVHGSGPTKLVFLMGLGGTLTSWQMQTLHFGHTHADKYSVLVLDNRGIGRSDKPLARYTTSEMARDTIELIDHVGWVAPRQINLVGISMGGMVAQEVACLVPGRVQSLSLVCTSSCVESGKSLAESARDRVKLFRPKSESRAIEDTAASIFPPEFLAARDAFELPSPATTPRCGSLAETTPDGEYRRFGSNFQRFQAMELHKRRALEPGVAMIVDGLGHAPIFERTAWFNELLHERLGVWAKL